MPPQTRSWTPVESRLLAEWLEARWAHCRTQQRVRLGRIPHEFPRADLTPEEFRALGVWRRWADAIVFQRRGILIVEAGIIPDPGDVSKLEHYCDLFRETPEFEQFRRLPVHGHLLYAVDDPLIHRLADRRRFTVEIFTPPWIWDYLKRRAPSQRRAPRDTGPAPTPPSPSGAGSRGA